MLPPIEFLYFDLGNVLIHFDHERACRQVAALTGLAVDQVRQIIFGGDLQVRYESGQLTTAGFCQEFVARSGVAVGSAELARAASDIFWLNRSMWPLVVSLRRSGQRLGILSNTCDAHWEFVSRFQFPALCSMFCELVLSFEVGVIKPDPRIYELAAQRIAVPGERIFFTDDRPENVAAARQAGWQAFPFVSAEETWRRLHCLGIPLA